MYGPLLSVLLMGMVPVWGIKSASLSTLPSISVAPPVARLTDGGEGLGLEQALSASGVLLIDADSGQTIFAANPDVPLPIASLTKLMTALLIVENHDLDEHVPVPADIEKVDGNVVHLPPNDAFTVGDLLSAMLIISANDASITLAQYHSGSVEAFVEEMNARAQALGLKHTMYRNPVGLDAEGQQSTPRELAWLTMYLLRYPEIAKRMGTRSLQITSLKNNVSIFLSHTHALMHSTPSIIAGKTGTTDVAGQCLLSVVEVDPSDPAIGRAGRRRFIAVLLRSADRYGDMRAIFRALGTE